MPRIQFELPDHFAFSTEVQVYISHVNQAGHLDNAQLLTLVSEGRVRFIRSLGYLEGGIDGRRVVVADMLAQYKSEAFHGETLRVDMKPESLNRYGFDLAFRLTETSQQREVARGKIGFVFIAPDTRRVAEMPEPFRARLLALAGQGA